MEIYSQGFVVIPDVPQPTGTRYPGATDRSGGTGKRISLPHRRDSYHPANDHGRRDSREGRERDLRSDLDRRARSRDRLDEHHRDRYRDRSPDLQRYVDEKEKDRKRMRSPPAENGRFGSPAKRPRTALSPPRTIGLRSDSIAEWNGGGRYR